MVRAGMPVQVLRLAGGGEEGLDRFAREDGILGGVHHQERTRRDRGGEERRIGRVGGLLSPRTFLVGGAALPGFDGGSSGDDLAGF